MNINKSLILMKKADLSEKKVEEHDNLLLI